jgi:hypothetical protein
MPENQPAKEIGMAAARKYVPDMYWCQDEDVEVHAVLDTDTSVWYFGEDSEEGAEALADELNEIYHNAPLDPLD